MDETEDLRELKESTAAALMKSIKVAADAYTDPGRIEQLANAYSLVANSAPKPKSTGGKIY